MMVHSVLQLALFVFVISIDCLTFDCMSVSFLIKSILCVLVQSSWKFDCVRVLYDSGLNISNLRCHRCLPPNMLSTLN